MNKVAVIGSSHVAALKQAWDQIKNQHPGKEITFFAARGADILDFKATGNSIIPCNNSLKSSIAFTSDGSETIETSDFDVFVVAGLFHLRVFDCDLPEYSSGLYQKMLVDDAASSLVPRLLRVLRKATRAPILILHNPLLSEHVHRTVATRMNYLDIVNLLNASFFSVFSAQLVPQPYDTIIEDCRTKAEFSSDSLRLNIGDLDGDVLHEQSDARHMNGAFGKLVLNSIL